jgi:methylenetetrahydrofolate dehydrogenase (NADP+) / methenyltetrahydrofolate cyclohydrolase
MVSEKSIIIDVGCTFVEGIAVGDVDFDAVSRKVTAISPVPGGVGPMTVATLIENTWQAFLLQKSN